MVDEYSNDNKCVGDEFSYSATVFSKYSDCVNNNYMCH